MGVKSVAKDDAAERAAVEASRALSPERWQAEARDTLARARKLREEVREDLSLKRWGTDDMQMDRYNVLASKTAWLFADDEAIRKRLIKLPDAMMQSYGTLFNPRIMPPDLPATRIEGRLTILIELLEMALGEMSNETSARLGRLRKPLRPEARARVFISHSGESLALHRLLRFLWDLDIEPVVAEWLPFRGKPVPKHVTDAMASCVSAIVFATATDEVKGRKQPGRGVLIETGLLQERFGERVIYLVEKGTEFGPMADNFACEFFTQDNLEKAFHRMVIEFRASGLI